MDFHRASYVQSLSFTSSTSNRSMKLLARELPRLLFDKATATLPGNARVGFVGRNGVGKTTLFRMIWGELAPESDSISLPRAKRLGRVEQEAPGEPQSLIDFVPELRPKVGDGMKG
jgi:ATPase subunit of ABC transporter with duplicated ATPase domains